MAPRKSKQRACDDCPSDALSDDEYDRSGLPCEPLHLTWETYDLGGGIRCVWVAQFASLAGYYGEGETVDEAISNLRDDLGPRPHYRVPRHDLTKDQIKTSIVRRGKAMAAAAITRARSWGVNLGGGDAVDATAKEFGVGKPAVNAARARLADNLTQPDNGRLVAGLSAEALEEVARASIDRIEMELLVADQTPWRFIHSEARRQFPGENG